MAARPVHRRVLDRLERGELTAASPVSEVLALGSYLVGRLRRALRIPANAPAFTLGDFWTHTAPMDTATVERFVRRALQNARSNQCVAPRTRTAQAVAVRRGEAEATYHTPDVNEFGYQAVSALLDYGRRRRPVGLRPAYRALPARLPARSRASRSCGCRSACTAPCKRLADGACVPAGRATRGFVGAPPHPDQTVLARSPRARKRVRSAARTRVTAAVRADPHSAADLAAGHRQSMRYSQDGRRLWRRPSPKVRLPP